MAPNAMLGCLQFEGHSAKHTYIAILRIGMLGISDKFPVPAAAMDCDMI